MMNCCIPWIAAGVAVLLFPPGVARTRADTTLPAAHADSRPDDPRWAFKPLRHDPPPPGPNPLDAFVNASLRAHGLRPNPPALPRELVRRLYFDLIGLPPPPEAITRFETDPSPDRYERLVEQLLSMPQYGERWARHWLDIVRFSESTGFEYDRLRDHAWPYRDYVIRSFNEDKPYDQFVREQVAGDTLDSGTPEGIIATSLLVCGSYDQAGNAQANLTQRAITREEEMEDLLSVVGQTFLGLTVNCARCHAHKFDPISHEDYYRIRAVFDGVRHGDRSIEGKAEQTERENRIAELKCALADAEARLALLGADESPAPATDEGRAPSLATPDPTLASVPAREGASNQVQRLKAQIEALGKPTAVAYAGVRVQPEPAHVLKRGDVKSPAAIVSPGALHAIETLDADFGLAPDAPEATRRARFAAWLVDPRNPLPARVMANRIWQYHFGQGLVATPSDFGANGARPSHPELLDWLASRFIQGGWSVKALQRLIVNSDTYRRSSRFEPRNAAADAENALLWRYSPHRLEAEILRDAMLAVSGQLNLQMGGPSFRPFTTTDFNATFYHPFDRADPEFNRRTIYRMNVNSGKDPMLDAFDCPDPSVKTPRRGVTTTPLQALALMNGSFLLRQAQCLADRALASARETGRGAIEIAHEIALGRTVTQEELPRLESAANARGLESVCWVLLNSTEFVYVR